MRGWYERYYKISDNEKISDKKMMVRFVVTLIIIIVCMIGMSATSIAFYTVSVETGSNTVVPSTFYVDISPEKIGTSGSIELDQSYKSVYNCVYHLAANTECKFTLSLPENRSDLATTGYCRITVGNNLPFYTKQFGKNIYDVGSNVQTTRTAVTFTVKNITDSTVDVRIEPCWGTCALTPIEDDNHTVNYN